MEKKGMLQVLIPGAAAAAVLLLVGLLIATSDWNNSATTKAGGVPKLTAPLEGYGKDGAVPAEDNNDGGMADSLPPVDAPEWQPFDGGMKTWDVKEGTGGACPPGAQVAIHYTGWTLNGNVFDSSRPRGNPADFPLRNLIQGWQLGIPGMKPGGIRRLYIPAPLAYGSQAKEKIPANSTLVFEVKLLGFK